MMISNLSIADIQTTIDLRILLLVLGYILAVIGGSIHGFNTAFRKLRKQGSIQMDNWTYLALDSNDTIIVERHKTQGLQGKLSARKN